jgi:predicted DNA-binding transcriptional regulator AlpA
MTAKTEPSVIPAALADVALIDGKTAAAAAGISISQWLDLVRRKEAPEPLRWGSRCSRWTISSVRDWLIERAASAASDTKSGELVKARASKASAAAQAKRAAAALVE